MIPSLPGFPQQSSAPSLPVAIDYPAALALRQMALVQDELPKYLLAPLRAGSSPQDASGDALEHGRAN